MVDGFDVSLSANHEVVYIIVGYRYEILYVGQTKNGLDSRIRDLYSKNIIEKNEIRLIYCINVSDELRKGFEKVFIGLLPPTRNEYYYKYKDQWEKMITGEEEEKMYEIFAMNYESFLKSGFKETLSDLKYAIFQRVYDEQLNHLIFSENNYKWIDIASRDVEEAIPLIDLLPSSIKGVIT